MNIKIILRSFYIPYVIYIILRLLWSKKSYATKWFKNVQSFQIISDEILFLTNGQMKNDDYLDRNLFFSKQYFF